MALKKSEKRLLILLGIVVVIFLLDQFVLRSSDDEEGPAETAVTRIQAASALLTGGTAKRAEAELPKMQFESWGRDPFSTSDAARRRVSAQAAAAPKHQLKGLFWKEGRAFALIDDMVIGEGEEDGGVRVDKIEGTEVRCRQGSRSFTLHWRESP